MRTVFFIPPLSRMSGGLANIYGLALRLAQLGYETALTSPCPAPHSAPYSAKDSSSGRKARANTAARPTTIGLEDTIAASGGVISLLPWEELTQQTIRTSGGLRASQAGEGTSTGSSPSEVTSIAYGAAADRASPARLTSDDCWVVPESWPNALSVGIHAGARNVIYAQSWNFLLTTLPEGVRWKQLPVTFLAVSEPVARFAASIQEVTVAGILPAAVHSAFFAAGAKADAPRVRKGRVRIAWMPRKNSALAEQAQQVAEAVSARSANPPTLEWVPIRNLPLEGVAEVLASCSLFLNTAFPEGFGLPPLEAMAAGCPVVGCTGFGGWEYMRQALTAPDMTPAAAAAEMATGDSGNNFTATGNGFFPLDSLCVPASPPGFLLPKKPWGGNGFYCNDGDSLSIGIALATAAVAARDNNAAWTALTRNAALTAAAYTPRAQEARLAEIWPRLSADMP